MKVSLLLEQSIKKQFRFKHIECLFVWILITRRCQKICKIYYTTGRLHMRLCLIIEALLERKIRTHLGRLHSSLKNPPSYKYMERHSDIWYNAKRRFFKNLYSTLSKSIRNKYSCWHWQKNRKDDLQSKTVQKKTVQKRQIIYKSNQTDGIYFAGYL